MRCRNFSIAYGILIEKNVPISSTVTPPVRSFLPWTGTIRYSAVFGESTDYFVESYVYELHLWVEVKDAYVPPSSLQQTNFWNLFLYIQVNKTENPKSSSGFSTHSILRHHLRRWWRKILRKG